VVIKKAAEREREKKRIVLEDKNGSVPSGD
jgi:hypothetical protein